MFRSEKYKRVGLKEETERIFDLLVEQYTKEWLDAGGKNKIQILWKREDFLSTQELYTLGLSLEVMLGIHEKRTKKLIQKSKEPNINNSKGAIFEIVALAMLHHSSHPVKTVKDNKQGYDGVLEFDLMKELRVSLKNFGITERNRVFEYRCEFLEQLIVKLLTKYDYPPVQILIDSPTSYPITSDWLKLFKNLDEIFKQSRQSMGKLYSLVTEPDKYLQWTIMIGNLEDVQPNYFHPIKKSYTLIVSGIYHKNEYRNVFTQIERGCQNLIRHSFNEGNGFKNALFIHLPISLNIYQCRKWVEEYMVKNPSAPISLFILYQPSLTRDIKKGESAIGHAFQVFERNGSMLDWRPHMNISPASGIVTDAIKTQLNAFHQDGTVEVIELNNRYLFQRGNHYTRMIPNSEGNLTGNMVDLSTGIHVHTVIQFPGQKDVAIISGKFAPTDDLLIL